MKTSLSVDIVVPVYSGAKYLTELVTRIAQIRRQWSDEEYPVQLNQAIFVLDSPIDGSREVIKSLAQKYSWLNIIELSRNYGEHAATVAGLRNTEADWVVSLDEDLQHNPEDIELLFKQQAATGADIVYANPLSNVHGGSWRDKSSRAVKNILSWLTGSTQIRLFNTFRLVRGDIARAAANTSSSQTYFDVALSWYSTSATAINIEFTDQRFIQENASGYNLWKLIKHARKLIVSSDLDVASGGLLIGFVVSFIAFMFGLFTLLAKLVFPDFIDLVGWTSLVVMITFFGGITIALISVALQYLHIIVLKQLGKPTFFEIGRDSDSVLKDWFSKQDEQDVARNN